MGIMSEIDIEIKNSRALRYMWDYMQKLNGRITEIEEQHERGFCPNCGNGMEEHKQDMETPTSKDYVECPQCHQVIKRK